MAVDIYQKYKMIDQRARRDPFDFVKSEMKDIAKLVLQALDANDREIALRRCRGLVDLDSQVPGKRYGYQIFEAIWLRNYKLQIPYQQLRKWREQAEDEGYIYIAAAVGDSGVLKIGASSDPRKSVAVFNARYSASMSIFYQRKVRMPFHFEMYVHGALKKYRKSGLTSGSSNELFQMNIQTAANVIEDLYPSFEKEI